MEGVDDAVAATLVPLNCCVLVGLGAIIPDMTKEEAVSNESLACAVVADGCPGVIVTVVRAVKTLVSVTLATTSLR